MISLFLLTIFFGCFETDEPGYYYSGEPAKFIEVVTGDYAVDGYPSVKSALFSTDTVIYAVTEQELDIMI